MSVDNPSFARRREERKEVSFGTQIIVGDQTINCRILNISVGGARVEVAHKLEHDSAIFLSIEPFGKFLGDIVWRRGEIMGIKFKGDPATMAEVVMAMAVY